MKVKQTSIGNIPENHSLEKLGNLVYIRSGYTLRNKMQPDEKGNAYLIQMSDLDHDLKQLKETPTKIYIKNSNSHQIKAGDILFLAKGTNNYATLFEGLQLPTVPASTFFVLSSKEYTVSLPYLTWYINQTPAQRYLESTLEGTNQRNIKRSSLLDLDVILPPLQQQQLIGKLYKLGQKEQQLLLNLREKKQQLLKATLLDSIGL